jgi:hypothetical protein
MHASLPLVLPWSLTSRFVCLWPPVFARRGSFVLDFYGALVPRGQLDAEASEYVMGLNEVFQVDPRHSVLPHDWGMAACINHSCDPNVRSPLRDEMND